MAVLFIKHEIQLHMTQLVLFLITLVSLANNNNNVSLYAWKPYVAPTHELSRSVNVEFPLYIIPKHGKNVSSFFEIVCECAHSWMLDPVVVTC